MKKVARKEIFTVNTYVPGKPIEEVKRELGLKEAIKLASNENAFPPSDKVMKAAKKALLTLNRYPDGGCFYLKKKLSRKLGVKPENLIAGNGSDEVIIMAINAFLKKGDEVIIAKPTFLIYEIASRLRGARVKFAPLKDFRYDVKRIVSLISRKTKLIFIANPDNPVGTYLTKKEIEFLISKTPKNTILFFDEAYFEFAKDKKDYPDTSKYAKKNKNIITTRSFSKIYSLAGARIGYGIADTAFIECLNKVREPFNVNSIAQEAAIASLDDPMHVKKTLKLIKQGKNYVYKELDTMALEYVPSVTNFLIINLGKNAKAVYRKLLRKGVIVREMSAWKLDNFIRVTIGTMQENRKFIKALKEVLNRSSK